MLKILGGGSVLKVEKTENQTPSKTIRLPERKARKPTVSTPVPGGRAPGLGLGDSREIVNPGLPDVEEQAHNKVVDPH